MQFEIFKLIKRILYDEYAVSMVFLFHELDSLINIVPVERKVVDIVRAIFEMFQYDYSAFGHVIVIVKSDK